MITRTSFPSLGSIACLLVCACAELPEDATEQVALAARTGGDAPMPYADSRGRWLPYGNNNPISTSPYAWKCGPTKRIEPDGTVLAQVCVIRDAGPAAVMPAVIVRNNRAGLYGAEAAVTIETDYDGTTQAQRLGRWECGRSGVGARSWSVCLGEWTYPVRSRARVGAGGVNGQALGSSSWSYP